MNWDVLFGFLLGLLVGLAVFAAYLIHKIDEKIKTLQKILGGLATVNRQKTEASWPGQPNSTVNAGCSVNSHEPAQNPKERGGLEKKR